MKNILAKSAALFLALAMILSLGACQLKDQEAEPASAGELSADTVAVKIGDKYTVTRGDIQEQYDYLLSMYTSYGMSAPTADADIETMQDNVVSGLVGQKILLHEADLMNITLSEDEKNGVDADVEDQMNDYMDMFRSSAQSEGATDVEARAKEIFNQTLTSEGFDMDMDQFKEYIRGTLTETAITNKVEAQVKSTVSVTAADGKAYFDDLLATQKETYAATPENYLDDEEYYEKFGGDPILVVPEGYLRVKSITISPTGELSEEYNTLSSEMDTLEAEYGELSLTAASTSATRLAEIRTEYAEKKVKADAAYETYIADARDKADKAYADLTAGKSFDDVLKEYGEDDVYTTYPIFVEKGLLMQKGVASSTWDQKLVDAVDKLKDGEYTAVINLDDMFYILQLVGPEKAGERTYEDVADEMTVRAQDQQAQTVWEAQQEEWNNDTSMVTYYEDAYRDIGK
jgi:hypothetical protein